jgi:hypothetical protein
MSAPGLVASFSVLASNYSSWENLRTHLTSPAGGSLRVIEPANSPLAVIRYTKGVSDFAAEHVPLFRSVVWNKTTNRPVSVAPVKAEASMPPAGASVRVSDFVDGTMLQAWKDATGVVGIATRTSLGAKGTFYSKRSFAELLNEALSTVGGTDAFFGSYLEPGQFISLVLQHREHKIVAPVPYNRVFVTHFGSIDAAGSVTFLNDLAAWPKIFAGLHPHVYAEQTTVEDAKALFRKYRQDNYAWQGLVFQSGTSIQRWRMRNFAYLSARALRGMEADPMERFLRLRTASETKKYLALFRDESNAMWALEKLLRERTVDLYQAYCDMNKTKTKGMRDLAYCFRPHVYALHGKYLATLPNPVPVLKETVIAYVNDLPVDEQLKLLKGPATLVPRAPAPAPVEDANAEDVDDANAEDADADAEEERDAQVEEMARQADL